ncbi:MAG: hypothetical protein K0Q71_5581 [Thermomicrobiales bacterium]|nr:hypothetical protein [Thermomicrobiales bacterium]
MKAAAASGFSALVVMNHADPTPEIHTGPTPPSISGKGTKPSS